MTKPYTLTISDSGVAEMIFNHPPVNAFNSDGWLAIAAEINAMSDNDAVRAIIIGAEGRGFCAGVDIKELAANPAMITRVNKGNYETCLLYTSPSPRDATLSRMPSSA